MTTLLVKNAAMLVTMDDQRREIPGGGLFIRDGFIEQVGKTADLPNEADRILDLDGHIHYLIWTLTCTKVELIAVIIHVV